MNIEEEDPYIILEVNRFVDIEEIKKSYRRLCLKYHPDKNNGNSDMFIKIQEAYEKLIIEHDNNINFFIMFSYFINSISSKKTKNIVITLSVQIEEIYNKLVKKLLYSYYDSTLKKQTRSIYLELEFWKENYKIEEYGDYNPITCNYEDLEIKIDLLYDNYEYLKINNIINIYDIYTTVKINLFEYYFGVTKELNYFNKEIILLKNIPYLDGDIEILNNYGICINKDERGDLYIFYELDVKKCDWEEIKSSREIVEKLFDK